MKHMKNTWILWYCIIYKLCCFLDTFSNLLHLTHFKLCADMYVCIHKLYAWTHTSLTNRLCVLCVHLQPFITLQLFTRVQFLRTRTEFPPLITQTDPLRMRLMVWLTPAGRTEQHRPINRSAAVASVCSVRWRPRLWHGALCRQHTNCLQHWLTTKYAVAGSRALSSVWPADRTQQSRASSCCGLYRISFPDVRQQSDLQYRMPSVSNTDLLSAAAFVVTRWCRASWLRSLLCENVSQISATNFPMW